MRKVALICAAAVVGALGITAVASAIQGSQTISVSLQSNRAGTKAKPRSVSRLTVVTNTTPLPGEPPFATKQAVIHFDKNLVFGASKFATCAKTVVQANPPTARSARGSAPARPSPARRPAARSRRRSRPTTARERGGQEAVPAGQGADVQRQRRARRHAQAGHGQVRPQARRPDPGEPAERRRHHHHADAVHDPRRRHGARAPRTSPSRAAAAASSASRATSSTRTTRTSPRSTRPPAAPRSARRPSHAVPVRGGSLDPPRTLNRS